MDFIATSFGLISTIGVLVGLGAKLLVRQEERRRARQFEDWKHSINTHDGKVWMRDYLLELKHKTNAAGV